MRESRDTFLRDVGGAVARPLIDDRAQAVLARLGGDRPHQLIREPDIQLDEIDLLVRERVPTMPRNLILRDHGDRERRPDRIGAVDQRTHAINARAQDSARAHFGSELQDERLARSRYP